MGWQKLVYVPAQVRWDDGNEIEPVETQKIVTRISAALETKGEVYRIEAFRCAISAGGARLGKIRGRRRSAR
jgi:hypothetical protein